MASTGEQKGCQTLNMKLIKHFSFYSHGFIKSQASKSFFLSHDRDKTLPSLLLYLFICTLSNTYIHQPCRMRVSVPAGRFQTSRGLALVISKMLLQ